LSASAPNSDVLADHLKQRQFRRMREATVNRGRHRDDPDGTGICRPAQGVGK
jgi:hypothetical protein